MSARTPEEGRWADAVQRGAFGVWDLDPPLERVHFAPQWKARLGFPRIHAADMSAFWRCRVHPDDLEPMLRALRRHIDGSAATYEMRFRLRSNGAGYRTMLSRGRVVVRDAAGGATRIVGTMADVQGAPGRIADHGLASEMPEPAESFVRPSFHAILGVSHRHPGAPPPEPIDADGSSGLAQERRRLADIVGDLLDRALRDHATVR